jgi:hypothetical protein
MGVSRDGNIPFVNIAPVFTYSVEYDRSWISQVDLNKCLFNLRGERRDEMNRKWESMDLNSFNFI